MTEAQLVDSAYAPYVAEQRTLGSTVRRDVPVRHKLSDDELVDRITAEGRDSVAVNVLFNRWWPIMVRFCIRYLESYCESDRSEEPKDVAQEIMIKCYKGLPDFDRRARFSTWIYCLARNHAKDKWRRKTLPVRIGLEELPPALVPGREPTALRRLVFRELLEGCRRDGGEGDETYAMVCLWLDGLTYSEIGRKYGVTTDVASGRIRRRLEQVADRIGDEERQ